MIRAIFLIGSAVLASSYIGFATGKFDWQMAALMTFLFILALDS